MKTKLGRPQEYTEGLRKLTASIPTPLYIQFENAWKALGTENLSRGITEALRLWLSTKGCLGTRGPDAAIYLDLKPETRAKLTKLAKERDKSPTTLVAEIVAAFLADMARVG